MKVLVTAFKPFNNQSINFSMEVLKHIQNVDKMIIDVVYDDCYLELKNKLDLEKYDLIVALGEARSRNNLTLEIQAKNISSCSLQDNKGVLKTNEVIDKLLPDIIKTNVYIDKCNDYIDFSYDAGKFVCNNLYFHLLKNYEDKSIFIHVPNCNNDETEYIKYAKIINKVITRIIE